MTRKRADLYFPKSPFSPAQVQICVTLLWRGPSGDEEYEDLIELGLAHTTFSHAHSREFERLREEAEARGSGFGKPVTRLPRASSNMSGLYPLAKTAGVSRARVGTGKANNPGVMPWGV